MPFPPLCHNNLFKNWSDFQPIFLFSVQASTTAEIQVTSSQKDRKALMHDWQQIEHVFSHKCLCFGLYILKLNKQRPFYTHPPNFTPRQAAPLCSTGTALHGTALHCTVLHCTALHRTALHCTPFHSTPLYSTSLLNHAHMTHPPTYPFISVTNPLRTNKTPHPLHPHTHTHTPTHPTHTPTPHPSITHPPHPHAPTSPKNTWHENTT